MEIEHVAQIIGATLRRARIRKGLSLADAARRSRGRFTASTIGCYERGERAISVERLILLSRVLAAPADRLVREVLADLTSMVQWSSAIDLTRVGALPPQPRRAVAAFVEDVRSRRGNLEDDVITLRADDIQVLAVSAGLSVPELLRRIAPSA